MARGTAIGERVVSQANTAAFGEGYSRIFGNRKPQRGRFIYDEALGKCVPASEYRPPDEARNAPILAGRFYENTRSTDGVDIGSRKKRREYMRAAGVADASDFSRDYQAREAAAREREGDRSRRKAAEAEVERAVVMSQKTYDREVALRRAQRLERDRRAERDLGE